MSFEKYKIENEIPVPKRGNKNPKPKGYWYSLINKMKKQDSIFFINHNEASSFRSGLASFKIEATLRAVNNGWRVWRLS